jgi:hypothetical protein
MTMMITAIIARTARADEGASSNAAEVSLAAGMLSFRGDDVGSGAHAGVVAMGAVGLRFPIGLRPELGMQYAAFGASASAKETNLFAVTPGLRWYAWHDRIRPWLGAHVDVAWFSWGGTCTVFDAGPGYVYTPQRGCNENGVYVGFDIGAGVEWTIGSKWSVGALVTGARVAPTSPPKPVPTPIGYPQPYEPSLTRTWILFAIGATLTL